MKVLAIGLGGFLGAICRYYLQVGINRIIPLTFPLGTFAVNMIGCLIIGMVYGLAEEAKISDLQRFFFAVGFCGSFTTYSTFAAENLELFQTGDYLVFGFYTILSIVVGIIGVLLGLELSRVLF